MATAARSASPGQALTIRICFSALTGPKSS